ncbi:MAG: phosphatase PAP2 family protein [Lachnospiraceae bacterium]
MELKLLNLIQNMRTPILDAGMRFITGLGDAGILWILLTVVLLLLPRTRKCGAVMAVALCVNAFLCNLILKPLFGRMRPFEVNRTVQLLIRKPLDFSFPSGHTAASFAAVTALFCSGEKRLWKICLIPAVLIAFSRLYLYVHYPTDVLGGIAVGILSGIIGYRLVELVLHHKKKI